MYRVPQSTYAAVLTVVRRVFDAHAAVLVMPDEAGRFFLAAADCPASSVSLMSRAEPGKGLIGWILRNRQPLIVNHFDQHSSHLGYYEHRKEEARIRGFMGCPLPGGGVLCVDRTTDTPFSEADTQTLIAFSTLVELPAPILSTDADDIRRYFARLERIQELRLQCPQWKRYLPGFLKLVTEATEFDHIAFAARPDTGGDSYHIEAENAPLLLVDGMPPTFPLAGGVVGWVFRNDVPVHTEGIDGGTAAALYGKMKGMPEFQSIVCLPVTVNKATTATLCFGGVEPRPIPQAMRSFMRMAVDELVQFLEALYLRHRVQSLMPKAKVHHDGAFAYNPDTAPTPRMLDND